MRETIFTQIPVGRLGEATEIACGVVFLASDDVGPITGATLTVNGGQIHGFLDIDLNIDIDMKSNLTAAISSRF